MYRKNDDDMPATCRLQSDQPLHVLRRPEVRMRTSLSDSELYRRIAAGDFPAPVKLGRRAAGWLEHEVDAWIGERVAVRDQAGGSSTSPNRDTSTSTAVLDVAAAPHRGGE